MSAAILVASIGVVVAIATWVRSFTQPDRLGVFQWALILAGLAVAAGAVTRRGTLAEIRARFSRLLDVTRRSDAKDQERTGGDEPRTSWQRNRSDVLAATLLVVVAVTTLLVFIREPLLSDDSGYFDAGRTVLRGDLDWPGSANIHRLGFVLSSSAAQMVLAYSPAAYYAVSFIFNSLLVVSLYALARLFFPVWAALIGALAVLWHPWFLMESTLLLPDWPALGWFVLGTVLFIVSMRNGPIRDRTRLVLAGASGASLFLALWMKEGMAPSFLALVVPLIVLERHHMWRRTALVAAGSLTSLLLAELMLNWIWFGSPLSRLRLILGGHVSAASGWADSGLVPADLTWGDLATRYLAPFFHSRPGVLLTIAVALALVVTVVTRSRGLIVLAGLSVVGWASVSLAVVSLDPLVPLLRMKERYFSVSLAFMPLLVTGAAWVAFDRFRRMKNRRPDAPAMLGTAIVLPLLLLGSTLGGLVSEVDNPRLARNGSNLLSETRRVAVTLDDDPDFPIERIVSDWRTLRGVLLFLPSDLRPLATTADKDSPEEVTMTVVGDFQPGDLAVINRTRLVGNRWYVNSVPDFYYEPPPHWIRVAGTRIPSASIYYVVDPGTLTRTATDLNSFVHAYAFREGDASSVTMEDGPDGVRFTLADATDVRIVLGQDRYHRAPAEAGLQLRDRSGTSLIDIDLDIDGAISVSNVNLWLFPNDGGRPVAVAARPAHAIDSDRRYTVAWSVGPSDGYTAFRVTMRAVGDGTITVRVSQSSLQERIAVPGP